MPTQDELFRREAQAAKARGQVPAQPNMTPMPMPPAQLLPPRMTLEVTPLEGAVGVTPDGKKVLQFTQGTTTIIILIPEELRRMIIDGLTGGITVAGGA